MKKGKTTMKKIFKIMLCMMIAVCLLSTVAFADASQTQTGEIIGPGHRRCY